jgi:hypothetical protein
LLEWDDMNLKEERGEGNKAKKERDLEWMLKL